MFLIYLAVLIYFLFFAGWYDHAPGKRWEYSYNLRPFREIMRFWNARRRLPVRKVFLNLFGNVIGFIPFGFFLPVISSEFKNGAKVAGICCVTSLLAELIQIVTRTGSFDVDDIILNTLGAVCGYLLFLLCDAGRRRQKRRKL